MALPPGRAHGARLGSDEFDGVSGGEGPPGGADRDPIRFEPPPGADDDAAEDVRGAVAGRDVRSVSSDSLAHNLRRCEREDFGNVVGYPSDGWVLDRLWTLRQKPSEEADSAGAAEAGAAAGDGAPAANGARSGRTGGTAASGPRSSALESFYWGNLGPTTPLADTLRPAMRAAGGITGAAILLGGLLVGWVVARVSFDQLCAYWDYYERPPRYQWYRVYVNVVQHAAMGLAPLTWLALLFGRSLTRGILPWNLAAALAFGSLNVLWKETGLYADSTLMAWQVPMMVLLLGLAYANCYIVARRVLRRHAWLVARRAVRDMAARSLARSAPTAGAGAAASAAAKARAAVAARAAEGTPSALTSDEQLSAARRLHRDSTDGGAASPDAGAAHASAGAAAGAAAGGGGQGDIEPRRVHQLARQLVLPVVHVLVVLVGFSNSIMTWYVGADTSTGLRTFFLLALPWLLTLSVAVAFRSVRTFRYNHPGTSVSALALLMAGNAMVVRVMQAENSTFRDVLLFSLYLGAKEVAVRLGGRAAMRKSLHLWALCCLWVRRGRGAPEPKGMHAVHAVVRASGWSVPRDERLTADATVFGMIVEPVAIMLANGMVLAILTVYAQQSHGRRGAAVGDFIMRTTVQLGVDWAANVVCLVGEARVLGLPTMLLWRRHPRYLGVMTVWAAAVMAFFLVGLLLTSVGENLGMTATNVDKKVNGTCYGYGPPAERQPAPPSPPVRAGAGGGGL